ncbi:MAG: hypothetical protein CL831_05095 [Crocinitomicaceae bacterium]|nr:hypothetical protein [Crocinitomicaceae bacterium]|tara:strand:+ start:522 stop:1094 length:573 start_codon:yes stop_codon:yes gene_type:complete
MNKLVIFFLNITIFALFFFVEPSSNYAQQGVSCWKNIFQSTPDTTQVVSQITPLDSCTNIHTTIIEKIDSINDTHEIGVLEKRIGMGHVQVYMDSIIMSINAKTLEEVKHLKGYRVQIHFGDLESAREVRAKCRRQLAGKKVYLESIAPNYIVSVGNYRDRWEAEFELGILKKRYPNAVIVPTDIETPRL